MSRNPDRRSPWDVRRLLRFAERERRALAARGYATFHPSPTLRVLRTLRELGPGDGRVFLEWGCGFGTVACLAACLGYEAYGIEIEEPFVAVARAGARALGLDVRFSCGSYLPPRYSPPEPPSEHVELDAPSGYAELDLLPQDADVIFVYPWPDDETFHRELFRECAHEGAMLLTFEGPDPVLRSHASLARDAWP